MRAVFVPLRAAAAGARRPRPRQRAAGVAPAPEPAAATAASAAANAARRACEDIGDLDCRRVARQRRTAVAVESAAGPLDRRRRGRSRHGRGGRAWADGASRSSPIWRTRIRSGDRRGSVFAGRRRSISTVASSAATRPAERCRIRPPIVLNDWAARDLGARVGDPLTLDYYVWEDPAASRPAPRDFRSPASCRSPAPPPTAISRRTIPASPTPTTLGDWDPPFPIDLRRVRPVDEEYWKRYRTTPKAFIPLEVGQRLWRSRYGDRDVGADRSRSRRGRRRDARER